MKMFQQLSTAVMKMPPDRFGLRPFHDILQILNSGFTNFGERTEMREKFLRRLQTDA